MIVFCIDIDNYAMDVNGRSNFYSSFTGLTLHSVDSQAELIARAEKFINDNPQLDLSVSYKQYVVDDNTGSIVMRYGNWHATVDYDFFNKAHIKVERYQVYDRTKH